MTQAILVFVIGFGLIGGSAGLIPFVTPETVQFGVRIPPAHTKSPAIAKARKAYYSIWIGIIIVVFAASVISGIVAPTLWSNTEVPLGAVLLVLLGLNYANYYRARKYLLEAKKSEAWYDGYTQGLVADTQVHAKLKASSLLWSLPVLLVTAGSIVLPAIRYKALPSRIPVHFNLAGTPTAFAAKSFWSVFGPSLYSIILVIIMGIVHLNLHKFAVRLDPSNPDASRRRYNVILNEGVKAVWILLAFVSAGTGLAMFPVWGIAPHRSKTIVTMTIFLILVGVIVLLLWIWRAAQTGRHVEETAVKSKIVARDDDRYWIAGIFYFNRSDTALFVAKRFGIGSTLNMGHPMVWVLLLIVCIIVIGVSL